MTAGRARRPRPRQRTVAEAVIAACAGRGTRRIFGVPGGGSSLALLDAAAGAGLEFVLAQAETPAAIMAAVTAELGGAPGVALAGIGPGAASAVNGVAYAALERVPLLLVTDCAGEDPKVFAAHQRLDQGALFAPLVKASRRLAPADADRAIASLLDLALAPPAGPVHVDLSAAAATQPCGGTAAKNDLETRSAPPISPAATEAARALLARARRPVIAAGLYARDSAAAAALARLAGALNCPVLLTYKGKGALPDGHPQLVGLITGGVAEAACLEQADLILFYGLDPVELIPNRWRYPAPVVALLPSADAAFPTAPAAILAAPLSEGTAALEDAGAAPVWTADEISALKTAMDARLSSGGTGTRSADAVVRAAVAAAPPGARATVDSGAHMFAAMALWPAAAPLDVLKSNGLSTMAYALPAAIAASLEDPDRPVIALTGDAGLLMCLGELATAARHRCRIAVVVFNDAALSLIDVKQQRRGGPRAGLRYPPVDFAAAAAGLGCAGWRVGLADDVAAALAAAFAHAFTGQGPAVVDVAVDPSGYIAQLAALRG